MLFFLSLNQFKQDLKLDFVCMASTNNESFLAKCWTSYMDQAKVKLLLKLWLYETKIYYISGSP